MKILMIFPHHRHHDEKHFFKTQNKIEQVEEENEAEKSMMYVTNV